MDWQNMGIFDIVVTSWMVIAVLVGMVRGAAKQVLSWIFWLGLAYILYRYGNSAVENAHLVEVVANLWLRWLVVLATVALGMFGVMIVVRSGLQGLLQVLGLQLTNAILGGILGCLRVLLVLVVLVWFFGGGVFSQQAWWRDSFWIQDVAGGVLAYDLSSVVSYTI
jgi:uncharacterized membrane protein required for colicin V production